MFDAVRTRLSDRVPVLAHRIEGAMQFAALMKSNALPQHTPAAHILPLGLTGGDADAMAGAFTQDLDEHIGVLLTVKTYDRTGGDDVPDLRDLIAQVIDALAGWAPGAETGVFRLMRGGLLSVDRGAVVYQIDFAITDQLRTTP